MTTTFGRYKCKTGERSDLGQLSVWCRHFPERGKHERHSRARAREWWVYDNGSLFYRGDFISNAQFQEARWEAVFPGGSTPMLMFRTDVRIAEKTCQSQLKDWPQRLN